MRVMFEELCLRVLETSCVCVCVCVWCICECACDLRRTCSARGRDE